jgi:hypothetical protein
LVETKSVKMASSKIKYFAMIVIERLINFLLICEVVGDLIIEGFSFSFEFFDTGVII